jgi:hypothetical protein
MQNRRSKRLTPDLAPLTPAIPAPAPSAQPTGIEGLKANIGRLKAIIAAERRRHTRLENALSKYQAVLETQITAMREAALTMGRELRPQEWRKQ